VLVLSAIEVGAIKVGSSSYYQAYAIKADVEVDSALCSQGRFWVLAINVNSWMCYQACAIKVGVLEVDFGSCCQDLCGFLKQVKDRFKSGF